MLSDFVKYEMNEKNLTCVAGSAILKTTHA